MTRTKTKHIEYVAIVLAAIVIAAVGIPYALSLTVGPTSQVTLVTFTNQTAAAAPAAATLLYNLCPTINGEGGCPTNTTTGQVTSQENITCTTAYGLYNIQTSQPISIAVQGTPNSTTPSYTTSSNWGGQSGLFGVQGDICTFNIPAYYYGENFYFPQYGATRQIYSVTGRIYQVVGGVNVQIANLSVSLPMSGSVPAVVAIGINQSLSGSPASSTTTPTTTTASGGASTTIGSGGGGGGGSGATTTIKSGATTTIAQQAPPSAILAQIEAWFSSLFASFEALFKAL